MSAFQPTTITLSPPAHRDPRGLALVAALKRDLGYRRTWNLPLVLIVGMGTVGLGPLLILLLRFRAFASGEKFQLVHVHDWLHENGYQNVELDQARARLGRGLRVQCWYVIAFTPLAVSLVVLHPLIYDSPWALYTLFATARPADLAWNYAWPLTLMYVFALWGSVRIEKVGVEQFVRAVYARVGRRERTPFVHMPPLWPRWNWLICATALLACGSPWACAMMLAAGAHKRYISEHSRDVRERLACRIEQLMEHRQQLAQSAVEG